MAPAISRGKDPFATTLRQVLTEVGIRLGLRKKEMAWASGLRPDLLSHLQSGSRRPRRETVLSLARGLALDRATTNRLLHAAGLPPLTEPAGLLPWDEGTEPNEAEDAVRDVTDRPRHYSGYEPPSRVALSPREAERLFSTAERRTYATRDTIFFEGDIPRAIHFIQRGRVVGSVTAKDGSQLTFDVLGNGEIFGELGVLSTDPESERSATIRALEPTVTRVLSRAEFERRRWEDRAVDDLLIRILRHRVLRVSALLRDALYLPAEQRVLRRLIDLEQVWNEGRQPTLIRVSQDELAEMAGTARATVNGILQAEGQRGTIEVGPPRRIAILDLDALKRQADP